jgi:hypothetical protein
MLGWVKRTLPQFDPFPGEAPFWSGLKAFAELAIVCPPVDVVAARRLDGQCRP